MKGLLAVLLAGQAQARLGLFWSAAIPATEQGGGSRSEPQRRAYCFSLRVLVFTA